MIEINIAPAQTGFLVTVSRNDGSKPEVHAFTTKENVIGYLRRVGLKRLSKQQQETGDGTEG